MDDANKSDKSSGGENRAMDEVMGGRELKFGSTLSYIGADGVMLEGDLRIPTGAEGVVVFVGDGSSSASPLTSREASILNRAGFATLRIDTLTEEEEGADQKTQAPRSDISLLARRVVGATRWLKDQSATTNLPIGYFGASTGTAAALMAAAQLTGSISAIVPRGGRPDLAGMALHKVLGPILLIAGEDDPEILALNRAAYYAMPSEEKLVILPNLSDDDAVLEKVAGLAADWFDRHLVPPRQQSNAA